MTTPGTPVRVRPELLAGAGGPPGPARAPAAVLRADPVLGTRTVRPEERASAERARDAEEWRRICKNPPRVAWSKLGISAPSARSLGGW